MGGLPFQGTGLTRRGCGHCPPGSERRVYLHHGQLYCVFHLPLEDLPLWARAEVLRWRAQTRRQEWEARRPPSIRRKQVED